MRKNTIKTSFVFMVLMAGYCQMLSAQFMYSYPSEDPIPIGIYSNYIWGYPGAAGCAIPAGTLSPDINGCIIYENPAATAAAANALITTVSSISGNYTVYNNTIPSCIPPLPEGNNSALRMRYQSYIPSNASTDNIYIHERYHINSPDFSNEFYTDIVVYNASPGVLYQMRLRLQVFGFFGGVRVWANLQDQNAFNATKPLVLLSTQTSIDGAAFSPSAAVGENAAFTQYNLGNMTVGSHTFQIRANVTWDGQPFLMQGQIPIEVYN